MLRDKVFQTRAKDGGDLARRLVVLGLVIPPWCLHLGRDRDRLDLGKIRSLCAFHRLEQTVTHRRALSSPSSFECQAARTAKSGCASVDVLPGLFARSAEVAPAAWRGVLLNLVWTTEYQSIAPRRIIDQP